MADGGGELGKLTAGWRRKGPWVDDGDGDQEKKIR
jgi:hypothetical protein